MKKKISIALVLSMLMMLCTAFAVSAEDDATVVPTPEVTSGTLGDTTVTWSFDTETGILTLGGTGVTPSYTPTSIDAPTTPPWYEWRSLITGVVVGADIECGNQLFYGGGYDNLKKVHIYGSTSTDIAIGGYAFADLRYTEKLVVVNRTGAKGSTFRRFGLVANHFDLYSGNHINAWWTDALGITNDPRAATADVYYCAYANLWDPEGDYKCGTRLTNGTANPAITYHNCVDSILVGDIDVTLNGTATLDYYCNKATSGVLIVGAYDEEGKLLKAVSKNFTMAKGDSELVNPVSVTNDAVGVTSYKAFVWDGFATLTPLLDSKAVSIYDVPV